MNSQSVLADVLPSVLAESCRVIDVRTPAEYRSVHVRGVELMPLDTLNPEAFVASHSPEAPVYILCQSGKRATIAAQRLCAAGAQQVFVVEGGTDAAVAAGLDCELGKSAISIERQVRIAAGLLVFFGTTAGFLVNPAFLAVPAFVGAGLAFAGISDTCGMGMMLSKMPWNR